MEAIKKFFKTKQAKITAAALCVVAVLVAVFLFQPVPNQTVVGETSSAASESYENISFAASSSGSETSSSEEPEISSEAASSEDTQESSDKVSASSSKQPVSSAAKPDEQTATSSSGMKIDPETGKDQYQTDPVPEGKPTPVEPEDTVVDENKQYTCTLSIRCDTILNNMDLFNQDKLGVLPSDGVILAPMIVSFNEGESVFDVLKRVTREQRIQMEFEFTPMYNSAYIEGIHNLYEFDCGDLSGWMYKVNGWFPNYGCSRYQLKQGDVIEWVYTCDLGKDVGGGSATGQGGNG